MCGQACGCHPPFRQAGKALTSLRVRRSLLPTHLFVCADVWPGVWVPPAVQAGWQGTQVAAYETDFFWNMMADAPEMRQSYGAGEQFLMGIDTAAAARNMTVQLCAGNAPSLLQSLTLPTMTQARGSIDYAWDTPPKEISSPHNWAAADTAWVFWATRMGLSKVTTPLLITKPHTTLLAHSLIHPPYHSLRCQSIIPLSHLIRIKKRTLVLQSLYRHTLHHTSSLPHTYLSFLHIYSRASSHYSTHHPTHQPTHPPISTAHSLEAFALHLIFPPTHPPTIIAHSLTRHPLFRPPTSQKRTISGQRVGTSSTAWGITQTATMGGTVSCTQ
jgi:hypothetical protein